MKRHILKLLRCFLKEEKANALVESALLFPLFLSLLMGVYDLGNGLVVNQKTIAASQVIADLLARNQQVTLATINDIVAAGRLSIQPYDSTGMGYDIVSVSYDADGNADILWRVTVNMDPNEQAVQNADILELTNDGLVIVSTAFGYTPYFSEFVTDRIEMTEVSYLRGRLSPFILCPDCPAG